MSTVRELHDRAMKLSDRSLMARHIGDKEGATDFARQALEFERKAAIQLSRDLEFEPTRSILFRSAATLAFDAEDYAEAARLTCEGILGYPPPEVRAELYELLERIRFAENAGFKDETLGAASIELT